MKRIAHEIAIIVAIIVAMYLIASSGAIFNEKTSSSSQNPNNHHSQSEFKKTDNNTINVNSNFYALKKAHREIKTYKLYKKYKLINPVSIRLDEKLIDINTANANELTELKGVGKVLARRIIEDRNTKGVFYSPKDLIKVKGIGEKKLEAILNN